MFRVVCACTVHACGVREGLRPQTVEFGGRKVWGPVGGEVWVGVGVPAVWRSVCVAACPRHELNVTDAATCQKHKAPARAKINVADATQGQKRKACTFGIGYDFDFDFLGA